MKSFIFFLTSFLSSLAIHAQVPTQNMSGKSLGSTPATQGTPPAIQELLGKTEGYSQAELKQLYENLKRLTENSNDPMAKAALKLMEPSQTGKPVSPNDLNAAIRILQHSKGVMDQRQKDLEQLVNEK